MSALGAWVCRTRVTASDATPRHATPRHAPIRDAVARLGGRRSFARALAQPPVGTNAKQQERENDDAFVAPHLAEQEHGPLAERPAEPREHRSPGQRGDGGARQEDPRRNVRRPAGQGKGDPPAERDARQQRAAPRTPSHRAQEPLHDRRGVAKLEPHPRRPPSPHEVQDRREQEDAQRRRENHPRQPQVPLLRRQPAEEGGEFLGEDRRDA